MAVSQAAIVAADIDTENRRVSVALHAEHYIPQRLLDQAARDISILYGLRTLELTAAHPASELHRLEPGELMQLFVSRNSMTRGSLAGAQWQWQDAQLTIRLRANGKKELEDLIPAVQTVLRERFAAPVTICVEAGKTLEGQELFAAMDSMRDQLIQTMPAGAGSTGWGYLLRKALPGHRRCHEESEPGHGLHHRGGPGLQCGSQGAEKAQCLGDQV